MGEKIKVLKEISGDNLETVTITIPMLLETKELGLLKEHGLEEIDSAVVDLETGILTLTVSYTSYYKGKW